jgi:hypothetical protein
MLRTFTPEKSDGFRPSLNPRTWVPEASMLTARPPKPLVAEVKRIGNDAPKSCKWLTALKLNFGRYATCPLGSMWEMTIRHVCTCILYRRAVLTCIWVTLFTVISPEHLRKFRGTFSSLIAMAPLFRVVQPVEWRCISSSCLSACLGMSPNLFCQDLRCVDEEVPCLA